jgi:hypothetical protein
MSQSEIRTAAQKAQESELDAVARDVAAQMSGECIDRKRGAAPGEWILGIRTAKGVFDVSVTIL